MSELDVQLAGKSLADYTNTQLRLALGAVLYTNTADMWRAYLEQQGYTGSVADMLAKYYIDNNVPAQFRNYINAGLYLFTPRQLFLDGSKGVIFDNADLSSFYLDSAGTTAATVNGLVGLQLDQSAGLALGSNLWSGATVSGESQDLGGGVYRIYSSAGVNSFVQVTGVLTIGKWYEVTLTVDSVTTVGAGIRIGDTGEIYTTTGSKRSLFQATATGAAIKRTSTACDIQISGVSFKELPGNHRYQTTTGSKPVLRGTPTGANLVTNGDFASGTGWSIIDTAPGSTTISGGTATMNNGTTGTSRLRQSFASTAGSYLITFTVSGYSGTALSKLDIGNTSGGDTTYGSIVVNANGTYTRYVDNVTSGTLGLAFIVAAGTATSMTLDNVSVLNVSAGSVTAPYGLQYDGVDDFLQTASVNFSATDKMFVCAGVRKLSDAAVGLLAELSANVTTNAGAFAVLAPLSTALQNFNFQSAGSALSSVSRNDRPAPTLRVLTCIGNISGDIASLTVSGDATVTSTTDQGTGNYGNYALYFGRRGGASLPYNGLDFGFVICGKTLTSTQISQTERYIAQRTGISL